MHIPKLSVRLISPPPPSRTTLARSLRFLRSYQAKQVSFFFVRGVQVRAGLLPIACLEFRAHEAAPHLHRTETLRANPGEWRINQIARRAPHQQGALDHVELQGAD